MYLNSVDTPMWINDREFLYPRQGASVDDIDIYKLNPYTNEITSSQESYQPQLLYLSNWLPSDDERLTIASQTFEGIRMPIDSPTNTLFSFLANSTIYFGNPITETFIDLCINATGVAFSPSDEIIISTGEEILYVQDGNTYRLAYHDGIVFDWRFPNDD